MPTYNVSFVIPFDYEDIEATSPDDAFNIALQRSLEEVRELSLSDVVPTEVVIIEGDGHNPTTISNDDADADAASEPTPKED